MKKSTSQPLVYVDMEYNPLSDGPFFGKEAPAFWGEICKTFVDTLRAGGWRVEPLTMDRKMSKRHDLSEIFVSFRFMPWTEREMSGDVVVRQQHVTSLRAQMERPAKKKERVIGVVELNRYCLATPDVAVPLAAEMARALQAMCLLR